MGGNGRRKRLLDVPDLVLCTAGLLACALASAETNDWLIVPGVRIGPLTGSSTRNSLQRMFAATKISDQPIDMGDGSSRPGTVVNADDPAAALAIIWSDETRMRPEQVFVCYGLIDTSCRWHTASAIGMNSRLSDLEKANGKPFVLLGFERDFAGTVISWEGGKLAREFEGAGRLVRTPGNSVNVQAGRCGCAAGRILSIRLAIILLPAATQILDQRDVAFG